MILNGENEPQPTEVNTDQLKRAVILAILSFRMREKEQMSDLKWSVYPEIAGEPQTNLIANKATACDELLHIARRRRWVRGRLVRFKIEVRSCFNC